MTAKMKNPLILTIVTVIILLGCGKKGEDKPELDEDKSNIGVYSGVLVGSSGYYQIRISESTTKAVIDFDGQRYSIQSQLPIEPEQDIRNMLFTDGTISLRFSVDSDGGNPSVAVTIPGHQVEATVHKELSNSPVYNYTGQSGATNGQASTSSIYNLTIQGEKYSSIEKNEGGEIFRQQGSVKKDGNKIRFTSNDGELNVLANYNPATGGISYSEVGENNYTFWFEFDLGDELLETGEEQSPIPAPF